MRLGLVFQEAGLSPEEVGQVLAAQVIGWVGVGAAGPASARARLSKWKVLLDRTAAGTDFEELSRAAKAATPESGEFQGMLGEVRDLGGIDAAEVLRNDGTFAMIGLATSGKPLEWFQEHKGKAVHVRFRRETGAGMTVGLDLVE